MSYKNADVETWSAEEIGADMAQCGLLGSPTRVMAVESVVLKAKESRVMGSSDEEIENLMVELIA
jgi:electron transfer flavoprotein beta subunit